MQQAWVNAYAHLRVGGGYSLDVMRRWSLPAAAALLAAALWWVASPVIALVYLDGPLGLIGSLVEDTKFAPGYTDWRFILTQRGWSRNQVVNRLGPPLDETWEYFPSEKSQAAGLFRFDVGTGRVRFGSRAGSSYEEIERELGHPRRVYLGYSAPNSNASFRIRVVVLAKGRLESKKSSFYSD